MWRNAPLFTTPPKKALVVGRNAPLLRTPPMDTLPTKSVGVRLRQALAMLTFWDSLIPTYKNSNHPRKMVVGRNAPLLRTPPKSADRRRNTPLLRTPPKKALVVGRNAPLLRTPPMDTLPTKSVGVRLRQLMPCQHSVTVSFRPTRQHTPPET